MPLYYDLTTFLDSRAEICQIFRGIFGKSKFSKGHSEINWPLVISSKGIDVMLKQFADTSSDKKMIWLNLVIFSLFFVLCRVDMTDWDMPGVYSLAYEVDSG